MTKPTQAPQPPTPFDRSRRIAILCLTAGALLAATGLAAPWFRLAPPGLEDVALPAWSFGGWNLAASEVMRWVAAARHGQPLPASGAMLWIAATFAAYLLLLFAGTRLARHGPAGTASVAVLALAAAAASLVAVAMGLADAIDLIHTLPRLALGPGLPLIILGNAAMVFGALSLWIRVVIDEAHGGSTDATATPAHRP